MEQNPLIKFIQNALAGFRAKNPVIFAIIQVVIALIYFGIQYATGFTVEETGQPLISDPGLQNVLSTIKDAIIVIALFFGFQLPDEVKAKKEKEAHDTAAKKPLNNK